MIAIDTETNTFIVELLNNEEILTFTRQLTHLNNKLNYLQRLLKSHEVL
jgi:hypothetical protein